MKPEIIRKRTSKNYRPCPRCGGGGYEVKWSVLGGQMRQLRQEKNLTVTVLAERMGITQHYLSEMECGRRRFTIEMQHRFYKALGLSV